MNADEARAFVAANRRRLKSGWYCEFKYWQEYIAVLRNDSLCRACYYGFIVGPIVTTIIDMIRFAIWSGGHER
jgi:hypothetical protein